MLFLMDLVTSGLCIRDRPDAYRYLAQVRPLGQYDRERAGLFIAASRPAPASKPPASPRALSLPLSPPSVPLSEAFQTCPLGVSIDRLEAPPLRLVGITKTVGGARITRRFPVPQRLRRILQAVAPRPRPTAAVCARRLRPAAGCVRPVWPESLSRSSGRYWGRC